MTRMAFTTRAGKLDRVHGGHGESGAVDDAADVAVQLDEVGDAKLVGEHLEAVLLVLVAQFGKVRVAVEGVVIDGELGVEGEDTAFLGHDQRVDLGEAGVAIDGGLVEAADELVEGGRCKAHSRRRR